jgi:hypothetical protein
MVFKNGMNFTFGKSGMEVNQKECETFYDFFRSFEFIGNIRIGTATDPNDWVDVQEELEHYRSDSVWGNELNNAIERAYIIARKRYPRHPVVILTSNDGTFLYATVGSKKLNTTNDGSEKKTPPENVGDLWKCIGCTMGRDIKRQQEDPVGFERDMKSLMAAQREQEKYYGESSKMEGVESCSPEQVNTERLQREEHARGMETFRVEANKRMKTHKIKEDGSFAQLDFSKVTAASLKEDLKESEKMKTLEHVPLLLEAIHYANRQGEKAIIVEEGIVYHSHIEGKIPHAFTSEEMNDVVCPDLKKREFHVNPRVKDGKNFWDVWW